MKTIMFVLSILFVCSVFLNGYFLLQDYQEDKRLEERLLYPNESPPEFMKNGEWFNIILNGYNGER